MILPTYNRAALIGRAIQSVLGQTYSDFELIIVDDGSTDNTAALVESFTDPRITYIAQPTNRGAAAARNVAIRSAKAPVIAFQDSDDEWRPDKLARQMALFDTLDQAVGVLYCAFWRITGDRKVYIPSPAVKTRSGDIHAELLKGNFITGQTSLVRRKCFDVSGLFDETLTSRHDWDLWIRISGDWRFEFMDEPLVTVYETPDSISVTQDVTLTGYKPIVQKHYCAFRRHRRVLAGHYLTIGVKADMLEADRFYERRKYLLKAVAAWPFVSVKYHLLALLSLFGPAVFARIVRPFIKSN